MNVVATLRSGGDFKPYDAITLAYQFKRHMKYHHLFVCMTDMDIEDPIIKTVPLEKNYPSWWSMVEMFRIKGPVLAVGLDMVVLDDISRLAELAVSCPPDIFYMARPQKRAFSKGERWCSGLQLWNGDWQWLYDEFKANEHIDFFVKEQRYTAHKLHVKGFEIRAIQDYFDGYYSYKNHCKKGKPKDARVVLFHGNPRPSRCRDGWVKKVYNNKWEYLHPFERIHDEHSAKEATG